jgi:hypothetical protein
MKKRESGRGGLVRTLARAGRVSEAGAVMEAFEARTLMDAVVWDGGAGTSSWHDAANWSRNGVDALPQNGDDVTIDVAANPTVTFNTGTLTLNSLTTNEALTLTGGTLGVTGTADINATLTVQGGTASGGTWDVTGGSLHASTSGGMLQNVQVVGDILLDANSSSLRISGTTRFTSARLQGSNTTLQASPGYVLHDQVIAEGPATGQRNITGAVGGVGTFTVSPTGVIRLATGSGAGLSINNSSAMTLVNNGLISAEAAGRTLTINNSTLTNNAQLSVTAGTLSISTTDWTNPGTITATGSELSTSGAWSSAGVINATNSTVNLGGTFASNAFSLTRTGGTVNFTGTMTNTGNTFTFNAATGAWNLMAGSIVGGTVVFNGANRLAMTTSSGTLTDVQVNGDLLLDTSSASLRIGGTTRFGAVRLQAPNVTLQAAPGYTLNDLVIAEGAAGGQRNITGAVGGTGSLTISPTGVLRLAAGSGGGMAINNSSQLTLVNNGLISAEAAGRTLTINNTTLTNNAQLSVSDGTVNISPTDWTNAGTIAATGGTLTTAGAWSSAGTITSSNAVVNLGGTFASGTFSLTRTGGEVNLTGTLTNTGNTLTFNAASGAWNLLGGSILGGTIVFNGTNRLAATTSGGTLADVQVNGELLLDANNVSIRAAGSTRFAAARLTAANVTLQLAPGYTLLDLVVAEGASTGQRNITGAVGGSGTLTIGATGVIRLAPGAGANLAINNSSVLTLVNNGLISAEAVGRTLTVNNSTFTNNAQMTVTDGVLNISPSNWTNPGSITATGGTLTTAGTWSSSGTISETNATVNLGGTFNSTGFTLARSGGTVNLTGTMTNTGNTLTFNAASGPWNLNSGDIIGGAIVFNGADRLVLTSLGGSLTDVQVNGELLLDASSANVRVGGTTRFAAARLIGSNASFQAAPGYTLLDLVVAEGASTGQRNITGAVGGSGTLTIGATGVIRLAPGAGANLAINNSSVLTLVNNGLISAEAVGRTLTVNNSTFTNNAQITVSDGVLNISPTNWTNPGAITATGGTLTTAGAWSSSGSITMSNATVNLGGTFNSTGFTLSRNAGTVNLTGTMTNTGNTLTFSNASGPWNLLSGDVVGGTIVFDGANRLILTTSGGSLTDVQVNGELIADVSGASVRVGGSTRFTAVRLAASSVSLQTAPGYVLHDLVVAEGAAAGQRSIVGALGGIGTLTVSPTGVIRLAAGSGANLGITNSSVLTLINQGLISNEAAGRSLIITPSTFTNNATVQALAGTLSIAPTTFTNYAKGVLTGGTYNAFGPGIVAMPAGTVVVTANANIGVGNAANFPAVATVATVNGSLSARGGGNFTITPAGGTLTTTGTVALAPGNVLTVNGNYTQAAGSTLVVEIQGTGAADIGRMVVTGTATIQGNLQVVGVNNYHAGCVNSVFLTAGTQVGQFVTQSLPTPITDHQALVIYIGNEIRFAISPPSDYNQDGVLNSQDLFDFLVDFFANNADFNNDGHTNSQDFFDFLTDFFQGCDE